MAPSCNRRTKYPYNSKQLVKQYFAQRIPRELHNAMTHCCAVTFRPGGYTSNFAQRAILPAGAAVMFQLGYEVRPSNDGQQRLHCPLYAFVGQPQRHGNVLYDMAGCKLRLDLSRRPRAGAGGQVIDPVNNPSALEVGLLLDKACQRAVTERWRLPQIPLMPRVLLGFPIDRVPAYEDTPRLRELAAQQLRMPTQRLGANGTLLLDRLLRETWERSLIQPEDARNWTGTVLVDSELCPDAKGFLRSYEDFSHLLGVRIWNPARNVQIKQLANPAASVLEEAGLGINPDFSQPIGGELIAQMVQRMRELLGDQAGAFSEEDLLDGITSPEMPLVVWSKDLPKLRAKLAVFANECCADEDLKTAVRRPDQPLWLKHACRIQVLERTLALSAEQVMASVPMPAAESIPTQEIDDLQLAG